MMVILDFVCIKKFGERLMKVKIGPYREHRFWHNWAFDKFGWSPKVKQNIKIDKWDTWSMDHTLSLIIVPMLKQLKETKHGGPYVYPEDVPAEIRPTKEELLNYTNNADVDTHWFTRWDYVLDEMIWAFEQKANDCWIVDKYSREDQQAHQDRMTKGFKLFGKYYENLWD
jgi:hypothetical protein